MHRNVEWWMRSPLRPMVGHYNRPGAAIQKPKVAPSPLQVVIANGADAPLAWPTTPADEASTQPIRWRRGWRTRCLAMAVAREELGPNELPRGGEALNATTKFRRRIRCNDHVCLPSICFSPAVLREPWLETSFSPAVLSEPWLDAHVAGLTYCYEPIPRPPFRHGQVQPGAASRCI